MEEKIFEVKGTTYKLTEIEEGSIYELKRQRKNGVFYKISRYNSKSMEEAIEYAKEYRIKKKVRTTKKEMKKNYKIIIPISYCSMYDLLYYKKPITYCTGIYGWYCDNYLINNNTLISTGYSPINGIKADYKKVKVYNDLAREIINDNKLTTEQKKKEIEMLLDKFVKEILK